MASLRQSGACLFFLSFILLSLGTVMLLFDGTNFLKLNRTSKEFTNAATSTRSLAQSVLSIILSVLGLAIGACGFVGFCTTSRPIVTVFLTGIAIDLLCRILLCSLMLISASRAHGITKASMEQAISLYGASENYTGVQFTKAVNEFAEKESCCGWAGSIQSESLFENSSWHRKLLANQLVKLEMKRDKVEQKPTRILLPTHCCTAVKRSDDDEKIISAPNSAGYCSEIFDLDKAREQGAIHAQDCLDIVVSRMHTLIYIYVAVHAVLLMINVISGFTATQFLKSSVLEQVKGAGDGRIMDDANVESDDDEDDASLAETKAEMKDAAVANKKTKGAAAGETSPELRLESERIEMPNLEAKEP